MGTQHKIKYYPVDNADNVLIKLDDGFTIQIDCQIRKGEENTNGVKIYDVKKDLLKELSKDSKGNSFVDLFVLSHPHKDHCLGFEENYYQGSPIEYSEINKNKNEIIIGELWVTQQIFSNDICEQAKSIRKEAKRRRKLFEENPIQANTFGNRLRIIGYNENDKTVEGLHYVPGTLVNYINGKNSRFIEFFIHAPFKNDLVKGKADCDHNSTSIVLHATFKESGKTLSRAFFGGDADHYIWEKVLRISENKHKQEKLKWDIFLSPHHCSWSFFNDTPHENNNEPKDYILELLDYKQNNAYIVSSSVKIEDNDNNPPHYKAKEQYVNKVGNGFFRNTATNKSSNAPEPLEFVIDSSGIKLIKSESSAAIGILGNSTPRAGA